MYTFEVWVRLNTYQTAQIRLQARDSINAKLIAEAQYGQGNVLGMSQING